MAKLYWRVKKNGKWTWVSAHHEAIRVYEHNIACECDWCNTKEEEWLTHEPEHYPLGEEEE